MTKVLHLIPDEKITDNVIENFEKVFNDNIFFILGDSNNKRYCKSVRNNVIFGEEKLFNVNNVDQKVSVIIIHGLNHIFSKLVLSVNKDIKIAWFAWGFDIYSLPKFSDKLYAPKTYRYLLNSSKSFNLVNIIKKNKVLRGLYYKYIVHTEDYYSNYEKVHQRINYFCTYIKEDFDLFTSKYKSTALFFDIGYFSIDQYLAGQKEIIIDTNAKNILIGNSNSVECNHLDAFYIIKETQLENDIKFVVPLNYGENKDYKNKILEEGKLSFETNFSPLLDFMEREAYFKLLSSCSTAVFYHYRQQAMGNIIAFLYMGGRVYLSSKNPVYNYLKRIGIRVFDLDYEFKIYKNEPLNFEDVKNNKHILRKYFSEDVILQQSKNLVENLLHVN